VEDGRALLTYGDRCIIAVFDEGYALAYAGDRMRAPFAAIVAESGKPVAMAAMSERLPPAAGKSLRAQAMASIDETLNRLDDLFLEFQTPAETALSHVLAAAAALQQVEQRLSTKLRKILLKVAYEAFTEFRNSGRRFYLGRAIHQRMAQRIAIDVTKASPGLKVYTEKSLRTIYRSLSADRKIQDTLARQGEKVLGDRISSFVSARPELMDLIGLPESAAARRPVDVAKALREQFGWKHHTTYC
jgi:hypothetical protein